MKYILTEFYEKFYCIGDKCSDTCCGGWRIGVDENTYQVYMGLEEPYRSEICNNIKQNRNGQYEIIKDKAGRCPFLNEKNLCNIYLKVSPDALSQTCKTYPRKIINYYDVIMATVSITCPVVTRMVLEQKEPIEFDYIEDENQNIMDKANGILFNELINGLVVSLDILQIREFSLSQRFFLLFLLTDEIQSFVDKKEIVSMRTTVDKYRFHEYRQMILDKYYDLISFQQERWFFISSIFTYIDKRFSLNDVDLRNYIEKCSLIPDKDEEKYRIWNEKFNQLDLDIEYENLAVQLVFECYMDALNGKSLYVNLIKLLLLLIMIRTQQLLSYNVDEKLSKEDRISIISKMSRSMAHSSAS